MVAQNQLIGREGNRFAYVRGRHPLSQCRRRGLGGLFGRRFENGLAHLFDPTVFGYPVSRRATKQLVFFEHLRQQRPRLVPG